MASLKSQLNITLYRGFLDSGAYVWSPFVTKLEARLRFAGLAYKTEPGSLQKAPRGKIPYIAISKASSEPPTILADTTLICESLIENGLVDDLNADLSLVGKAQDLAFRALLEDKLYFYQVCAFSTIYSTYLYHSLNFHDHVHQLSQSHTHLKCQVPL